MFTGKIDEWQRVEQFILAWVASDSLKHTFQYALLDYKYLQSGTKVVDTLV